MASVEEEKLMDELLKEWDQFGSEVLLISGMANDFIAKNGINASSTEITEHITGVPTKDLFRLKEDWQRMRKRRECIVKQ